MLSYGCKEIESLTKRYKRWIKIEKVDEIKTCKGKISFNTEVSLHYQTVVSQEIDFKCYCKQTQMFQTCN